MKNKLLKIVKLFFDSDYRFIKLAQYDCYKKMPDDEFIKRKFKGEMGYELDLTHPETFNEKLQWLKLFDRKDIYTQFVDKYEVKKYVGDVIGKEYIIPTIGIWDDFDNIDFSKLPNQFILKCTHDSGGLVICKDKSTFDYKKAKAKINRCLNKNFYYVGREWPYKNVKPRIIAEPLLKDNDTAELRDYKFFCFNGTPRIMFVATDRNKVNEEVKFDFFDMDFNHLPIRNGHPLAKKKIEKPLLFNQMKDLAAKLSMGIPQIRVDLYEVNGKIFFGELTLFQHSGFCPIEPKEWDYKMGEWIMLPNYTE